MPTPSTLKVQGLSPGVVTSHVWGYCWGLKLGGNLVTGTGTDGAELMTRGDGPGRLGKGCQLRTITNSLIDHISIKNI